jgi:hypothetical protein
MLHSEVHSDCVLANSMPGGTVILADPCTRRGLMVSSIFRGCRGGSCACWEWLRGVGLTWVHTWSSPVPIEGVPMLVRGPHHSGNA